MSEDNQKNRLPLSTDETTAAGETARRLLEEKDADARTRSYNGFFRDIINGSAYILGGIPNLCKYDRRHEFHGSSHVALHVPSGIYVPAVSHGEKREEGEKCPAGLGRASDCSGYRGLWLHAA